MRIEAGESIEGAVAQVFIPRNATLMRNTQVPTVHFLVGGHRGCPMPLMVELPKKGGPSLGMLRGKEVCVELQFGTHIASRQKQMDVLKAKIVNARLPNVEICPQPKYHRIDLRPLDQD